MDVRTFVPLYHVRVDHASVHFAQNVGKPSVVPPVIVGAVVGVAGGVVSFVVVFVAVHVPLGVPPF